MISRKILRTILTISKTSTAQAYSPRFRPAATAVARCSQLHFSPEINMKLADLWTNTALTFGNTIYVYLRFISPPIGGLLRSSTHAWNSSTPFNYPLASGFGLLIHTGRVHSYSFGYRNHCDFTTHHSRPTYPVMSFTTPYRSDRAGNVSRPGNLQMGFQVFAFNLQKCSCKPSP